MRAGAKIIISSSRSCHFAYLLWQYPDDAKGLKHVDDLQVPISNDIGSVDVSIIVPCRNERDAIESCVRSILNQVAPPGGFEVIIADGCSDDGTREILEKIYNRAPRVRVIDNPEQIVSTGLNRAIQSARGAVIIRMDAHTEYAPDYVSQCVETLEETGADCVGGPWVARGTGFVGRAVAAAFQSPFAVGGAKGHDPSYEGAVDTVYLGCWRREVFDRIGLFDPKLVRNQDDEFSLRIRRAGGLIWQSPRIRSWYNPRNTLRALFRQYEQYGYWKVKVIQKHWLPASVRHLAPGVFVLLFLGLPFAFPFFSSSIFVWLGLVGSYILCNLALSVLIAAQNEWRFLLVLPLAFGSFHFGYGVGFLRGLWDFVLLRRQPAAAFSRPTRPASSKKEKLV